MSSGIWTGLNSTGRPVETACVRLIVFCFANLRDEANTILFSPDLVITEAIFGKLLQYQGIESTKYVKAVILLGDNPLTKLNGTK